MDEISSEYIRLSHALNRHVDGFIDAYFGPRELSAGEVVEPKLIVTRVRKFRDEVSQWAEGQPNDPHARRRSAYLDIQARAMEPVGLKLAGESVSFCEETLGCFDVDPLYTPDEVFETAMKE